MGSDTRRGVATLASEFARDSLTDAVTQAMEEADRGRARRTRRRWLVVTTLGVGLGTAIGYLWGTGELEGTEFAEFDEYAEAVTEAAPEEVTEAAPIDVQQEQQSGGLRSSFPKLAIAGAAALGIYVMRKRSDRTEEIVSEATQRARSVREGASEQAGERAEAVAGAGEGGGESEVEEMGEEEAGDAFDDRFEGAAEEGEDVQEGSEETPEAETPDHDEE